MSKSAWEQAGAGFIYAYVLMWPTPPTGRVLLQFGKVKVINATAPEAATIDERPPEHGDRATPAVMSFKDYYVGTIVRPYQTFGALAADSRRVRYGIIALAINAQLYTLVYVFLSFGGAVPASMKPWLAIPAASYYRFNEFLLAPSMFICWILGAGVAQLLSRAASGKGSFEDMLGVLGFGISVACLPALLVELPMSFLGAVGALAMSQVEATLNSPGLLHEVVMLLYSLSITWSAVLFFIGIRAVQRIGRGPAIAVGAFAYLAYETVFVVFNR